MFEKLPKPAKALAAFVPGVGAVMAIEELGKNKVLIAAAVTGIAALVCAFIAVKA